MTLPLGFVNGGFPVRRRADARFVLAIAYEQPGRHPGATKHGQFLGRQVRPNCNQRLVHDLAKHQPTGACPMRNRASDGLFERGHALRAVPDGFHHRKTEQLLHQRQIDLLACGARFIRHVQTKDEIRIGLHDLREQDQVTFKLSRIGHHHNDVRRICQLILRHALVGRKRAQAVGARQIDDVESELVDFAATGTTFDGNPGVVRHVLPSPGKRVEQRRLATIGIAGKRDPNLGRC